MAVTPAQIQAERLRRAKPSQQSQQKSAPVQRGQTKNPNIQKAVFDEKVKREQARRGTAKPAEQSGGFWRTIGNQLLKPVSSAANLSEDIGKTIGFGIANMVKPELTWKEDAVKKGGIDFLGHQKDVWTGKNKRMYSDIMAEIGGQEMAKGNNVLGEGMTALGVAGDFALDPLNKLKILGLTQKGNQAAKTGSLALSAAEQGKQGQRALLQFGNTNILPGVGNKVMSAGTVVNDAIRANKYGAKAVDALAGLSTAVRPAGVAREEWKTISDATRSFKKGSEYATSQAINQAAELEKDIAKTGADDATRSALLHAVEKGDSSLVPQGMEDIFQKATIYKNANEEAWKQAGGATVENYGLPHVATDAVKESQPTTNMRGGGKIYSPATGQDIQRQWVKVDGKVANLEKEGIKLDPQSGQYFKNVGKETADGGFASKWEPVKVEQATAKEVNEALVKEGKEGVFKEDLPTSLAVGGISSGKKAAGESFIKATKGKVKSDRGLQIIDETYQRLTNNEAVNKAIKAYDKVLGLWKAQILLAPSYHVRNEVGNLWNNYLAGTSPVDYVAASKIQQGIVTGKMDDVTKATVQEMEQQGVIGGSQYGKDITQTIADEIGGASWNPLSQRFGGYKANRAIGTTFEDNARIAHYLSKRREGFSAVEAAKSVEKFLFDYADLTWIEQNVMKRVLPFYTWSRKNIPLQLEQFVKNPGKFATAAKVQKNVEEQVSKPDERYMSEYLKNNSPMRIRDNKDGSTEYLLLGQWLPAAQAIQFLSQAPTEVARGVTPLLGIAGNVSDVAFGTEFTESSFFKDTLGRSEPLENFSGDMGSFLGVDMKKKTMNVLRGIRVLNEIDKWNPGLIFGGKDTPSAIPGGSQNRGAKHSPDSTEGARLMGLIMGKTSTYDPANSKTFYDQDTQDRMGEYTRALDQALRFKNQDRANEIILEMEQFQQERDGKKSKVLDQYNLMGDQYLQDRYQQKQAEFKRDDIRKQMREKIREGLKSGKNETLTEALKLDPTYAKQALTDALKEKMTDNLDNNKKKLIYEVEKMKTDKRLNPFY